MNKIKIIVTILSTTLLLAACNPSIERSQKTIGLMQDNVTQIINELYAVQEAEQLLQSNFEEDLTSAGNDLNYFNREDSLVLQNIQHRSTSIDTISKKLMALDELIPELENLMKYSQLPTEDFTTLIGSIHNLSTDLTTYLNTYQENLVLEKQTFQFIGNPEIDYNSFFDVFDNINQLAIINDYNLNTVLAKFEPINRLLVDIKVKLVTLEENKE